MGISAQLSAIAKYVFPSGVPHAYLTMNPGWSDSVKKTDAGMGESYRFSVAYSGGGSGSMDYAAAYAVAGNALYQRFTVTTVTDYALARMNGQDYEKLSGDKGAVVDAWKDRVDWAYQEATRSHAIQYFGDGTGVRGNVSSGQASATLVIGTAAATPDASLITNFYAGLSVTAAATATGALRDAGVAEIVLNVSRSAGTLTSTSVAWNTVIANLGAGDFLFRRGDALNTATAGSVAPTGMASWLVGGAAPAALWGATRTVDAQILAGTALDGTNLDMADAVLQLCSDVSTLDSDAEKTYYCNPKSKVNLVKLLEAKARYVRPSQKGSASVGVDTIEFETDSGPVKLKGDINVGATAGFLLANKHCETISVGKTPKPMEKDGQLVRARDAYDAYEMRIGSYLNFANRFPGASGRLYNWGV